MSDKVVVEPADVYQFLNSYYIHERYDKVNNVWQLIRPDALILVYSVNGEKQLKIVEEPSYTFRKSNKPNGYIHDYVEISESIPITCKYRERFKAMAEAVGMSREYFDSKRNGTGKIFEKRMLLHPDLFGCDIDIEDYYKMLFHTKHTNKIGNYDVIYTDIETDLLRGINGNPMIAQCPVNAVSMYHERSNTMYTWLLDHADVYKQLPEFKRNIDKFKIDMTNEIQSMKNHIKENIDKKKTWFFNIPDSINMDIRFFKDEIEMLKDYFDTVHKLKSSYNLSWNFSFDSMTMINRLRNHAQERGFKVEDIICHPDIPEAYRFYNYKEDTGKAGKIKREYQQRWHTLTIPGYTKWFCQMATYAILRKSEGTEPAYNLEYICMKELGLGKLDYTLVGADIKTLVYKDYSMFVKYNIIDVFLQFLLNLKTMDVDNLMSQASIIHLDSVSKVTKRIKNAQYMFYQKKNRCLGNNPNALNYGVEDNTQYAGAIVADPSLNRKYNSSIFAFPTSTIYTFVIDNDLKSMYPSIVVSGNIYKTTLYFQITEMRDLYGNKVLNSDALLEDCFANYHTGDLIRFGSRYLNLPTVESISDYIITLGKVI